jgi:hypothetical protein
MRDDIYRFVATWLPCYIRDNRNYLTVAIGCTGGQHRSVHIAEWLAGSSPPRPACWSATAPGRQLKAWLALIRPGDWLVFWQRCWSAPASRCSGRAAWPTGPIIRQEAHLRRSRSQGRKQFEVAGPLGTTLIAVEPGRARVVSDPGPRQYCVKQGWLMRPGEIAICAPNRVSVQIAGRTKVYDSISY